MGYKIDGKRVFRNLGDKDEDGEQITEELKNNDGKDFISHGTAVRHVTDINKGKVEEFEAKESENKKREDRKRKIKEYKKYGG